MFRNLIAGLGAVALLAFAGAASAQSQAPAVTSLDDHITCAALFFSQSKITADAETKEAFESATALMMERAETLGARQGVDAEAVLDRTAAIADTIDAALAREPADRHAGIIWNWGVGLNRCITTALDE